MPVLRHPLLGAAVLSRCPLIAVVPGELAVASVVVASVVVGQVERTRGLQTIIGSP